MKNTEATFLYYNPETNQTMEVSWDAPTRAYRFIVCGEEGYAYKGLIALHAIHESALFAEFKQVGFL